MCLEDKEIIECVEHEEEAVGYKEKEYLWHNHNLGNIAMDQAAKNKLICQPALRIKHDILECGTTLMQYIDLLELKEELKEELKDIINKIDEKADEEYMLEQETL